jgi:hypothetical protein
VASLAACTTPSIQTGPDAETSFDGLVKVDNTQMDTVWVKPGVDLRNFDKLMSVSAGIKYRNVPESNRPRLSNSGDEFNIGQATRDLFEETLSRIFREQIGESERFELVEEAGPSTLVVTGGLIDVVSFVPPDDGPSRIDVYISSLGAATLVLEIADSVTGEVYMRGAGDRDFAVDQATRSTSSSNRFELERELERWANQIRDGIEYLGNTPMVPAVD